MTNQSFSSDNLSRLLQQYENIQSILFTTDYSHFESFLQMQNFLECADSSLTEKINQLDQRMNIVHQQYVRTSTVYEINNKKRARQQQLLNIQRQKLQIQLQSHKQRLQQITIHPITLVLKQKQNQISKLYQTKQIVSDFYKLLKGDEQQIKKLMSLDDKNFNSSSMKIFIFKQLMEDDQNFNKPQYQMAKNQIRKKFAQLKNKILINFKQAYYKKDIIMMKQALPYCQEYDLMQQVSQFYNQQVFKQTHKIIKIQNNHYDESNTKAGQSQIKNFFFLLQRGFLNAFNTRDQNTGQKNFYNLQQVLGQYNKIISRKLISYAFQKLIKQSIQNVLKNTFNSGRYLIFLQLFYSQCKTLLKNIQPLIQDQRILHLMSTYFESIFDIYLESYLSKQVSYLSNTLEQHITDITEQIKTSKLQYNQPIQQQVTSKKFSIKKIMEFKIQEKVYNPQISKIKIQTLNSIFMASSIQKIFMTIKQSLNRNMKISKINQISIYSIEIKTEINYYQFLLKILANCYRYQLMRKYFPKILRIAQIQPGFGQKTLPIQSDFFNLIPNINLLLQRMEYLYVQNKKQAKYLFAESLKLQQKKETLISECQKKLNKIVGDALANILTVQNSILKTNQNQYFVINQRQKNRSPQQTCCCKVMAFLQKYLRQISKISNSIYKTTILKQLGIQFMNLLLQHYSRISYTKQGLGNIFVDIANYKKIILQINYPEIQQKYKILRALIDIYVIKNDQKTINSYIKGEKDQTLKGIKQEMVKDYVNNKYRNQKTISY